MNAISRFIVTLILIAAFLSNALPCGPGSTTPLFDTTDAPESPYTDYAAGRLGIVKPTFRRSVLYAAYRYIAGSGMSAAEQQSIVEVWKAEIDNKDFADDSVDEAVRTWVAKRQDVVGKEDKTPDIYVERAYGGYDFFPNCTKNAFETATETLADRVAGHGPSDPNVGNWIRAQDQVFNNCSNGKQMPDEAPPGAPDWLQKDRAYQMAAALFYSLDYAEAKRRFAEIAQDSESPWAETADYLVARTLIRQASLSKTPEAAAPFYDEAEAHLARFISKSGKYTASSERLDGLVKYRRHPRERVSELAKKLAFNGGNENFRQDLIDYNWLLDKFESEGLAAEEKRKEALKPKDANAVNTEPVTPEATAGNWANGNTATRSERVNDDDIEINLYSPNYVQNWKVYVRADATDDEAIAEAEKVVTVPLTDEMKKQVREMRQSGYANRFKENRASEYEGGYYGTEKLSPSLLPDFLRQDELSDWLFVYQMSGPEAYLYAFDKYKASGSELWLMTALAKADKSSTGLARLLDAANKASRLSPAYITIAYNQARILLALGKTADARKLIDDMLDSGDTLTISARNSFSGLKVGLAATLEDYLKYSLKKPYAFDFDGDVGTIEEIIAKEKQWFNPETDKEGREAYDAEIEERYKEEKLWQQRSMLDEETVDVFNQHFSSAALVDVVRSPALPDYMRERFAIAIWTRAWLLGDKPTLDKISPNLVVYHPEFEPYMTRIANAKTPAARDNALLFFVLKNPLLSPYIEDGMGKTDNEMGDFDSNDWWCSPYDMEYNDETSEEQPKALPARPAFLTPAQSQTAQAERKRLKEIGDAPKYLAEKTLEWAKRSPTDRRVPEALYIMIGATGWTKYGCGNDEELRDEIAAWLKRHYPNSEWTVKLRTDESDK